jgi:GNAT superfamily N-acetyltransferase
VTFGDGRLSFILGSCVEKSKPWNPRSLFFSFVSGGRWLRINVNIKKVGLLEWQELREIGIASYLPHYSHLWKSGGVEWYMNRCFGEDFLVNEIADANVEYFIVKNDGENIGILKIILLKPVPNSEIENALYLEKIYFVKEWTGKGVGGKTIDFVLRRAAELGRDYVWLEAMDTAAKPIAAYEKAGFEQHSRVRLSDEFKLMKEEFRGMVVMTNCAR